MVNGIGNSLNNNEKYINQVLCKECNKLTLVRLVYNLAIEYRQMNVRMAEDLMQCLFTLEILTSILNVICFT